MVVHSARTCFSEQSGRSMASSVTALRRASVDAVNFVTGMFNHDVSWTTALSEGSSEAKNAVAEILTAGSELINRVSNDLNLGDVLPTGSCPEPKFFPDQPVEEVSPDPPSPQKPDFVFQFGRVDPFPRQPLIFTSNQSRRNSNPVTNSSVLPPPGTPLTSEGEYPPPPFATPSAEQQMIVDGPPAENAPAELCRSNSMQVVPSGSISLNNSGQTATSNEMQVDDSAADMAGSPDEASPSPLCRSVHTCGGTLGDSAQQQQPAVPLWHSMPSYALDPAPTFGQSAPVSHSWRAEVHQPSASLAASAPNVPSLARHDNRTGQNQLQSSARGESVLCSSPLFKRRSSIVAIPDYLHSEPRLF
eukprot:TRINITY_DN27484_c0_g1_i1.p1 TRINITY_DN27484_c0_g1~~TRINITY_DN27484_c0_g1_i1.p1  ORF type:complete len:372 (-),score=85.92 TRINITY_DN27484_c0_g1_i1:474-1553(-)